MKRYMKRPSSLVFPELRPSFRQNRLICQQCQAQLMEGIRFCPQCGTPVTQPPVGNVVHGNQAGLAYLDPHQRAIEDFDEVIQLDPNHFRAYCGRGAAYYFLGQFQRAIEDFDEAIQLDPNYSEAYYGRVNAYYCLGQYQRAFEDYEKAIQLYPDSELARGIPVEFLKSWQASTALFRDQRQRDLDDFDKAVQLDPDDALAYLNCGEAYSDFGEHQRAIQDYDKAIQLDPNDAGAYGWPGLGL